MVPLEVPQSVLFIFQIFVLIFDKIFVFVEIITKSEGQNVEFTIYLLTGFLSAPPSHLLRESNASISAVKIGGMGTKRTNITAMPWQMRLDVSLVA